MVWYSMVWLGRVLAYFGMGALCLISLTCCRLLFLVVR